MARLGFSASSPVTQADWDKLIHLLPKAVEGYDFDSGWVATPADKVIRHNLDVVVSEVHVYQSANKLGDPFAPDTYVTCGRNTITITGSGPFCRVCLQVGS